MTIQLTAAETAELHKLREPTAQQLAIMARHCGHDVTIKDGLCTLPDFHIWNPTYKPTHNHELLAALIVKGDCKLFYDHEINEFFVYQYNYTDDNNPPLAHHASLDAVVVEAAMNLWFPEDE